MLDFSNLELVGFFPVCSFSEFASSQVRRKKQETRTENGR